MIASSTGWAAGSRRSPCLQCGPPQYRCLRRRPP